MSAIGQGLDNAAAASNSTNNDASPPPANQAAKLTTDATPDAATRTPTLSPFDDANPDADDTTPQTNLVSTDHRESLSTATQATPDDVRPPSERAPPIEETPAQNVDPRIAALQAMFPTFDDLVLQSVLESVNWDQDRAIDMLLGMSDPEYKPDTTANQPPAQSQTDLDEQFARQLMLQEQQAQQAAWEAAHPRPPGGGRRTAAQPVHQTYPQTQTQPQGNPPQGGQIASDLQEQFTKVAEAGKKTFSSIFSKVKAKIQEFDAPRSDQSTTQPTWGPSSSTPSQPYNANYVTSQQPAPQPIPSAQQPAYYDPNPQRSPSISPESSPIPAASIPPAAVANPWSQSVDAPLSSTTSQPSHTTGIDAPRASSGIPGGGAAPIDGNKLGLLPKRPVSLLRAENGGTPSQLQRKDSEEDDLEYVQNPFEEGNRK